MTEHHRIDMSSSYTVDPKLPVIKGRIVIIGTKKMKASSQYSAYLLLLKEYDPYVEKRDR
jgi:hypothetical protein